MVTWQGPVPEQAPDHPEKTDVGETLADMATLDPASKGAEHSGPQLMPGGLLVTVPVPLPLLEIVKVKVIFEKVAVTDFAESIVT
jgi:hypothetical protein